MHPKFQQKLFNDSITEVANNNRAILESMLSIMEDEELPEMESMIRWIIYNLNQLNDIQIAHLRLTISAPKEEVVETELETENDDVEDYPEEESLDEDEDANNSFTLKLLHLDSFNYSEAQYHCYFKLSGERLDENIYNLHSYDNSDLITELTDSMDEMYPYLADLIFLTFPILEHLLERSANDEIEGSPLEGDIRYFSFETDQAKYEVEIDLGFIYNLQTLVDTGEPDENSTAD
jgi:hypothetical protein